MTLHSIPNSISIEIISTGDEVNRGEVVDTNAAWLAAELTQLGFYIRFRQGINDQTQDLKSAFAIAASRSDVILVTGGLGPTEDDLTVDVVSDLLQVSPLEEASHKQRLLERSSFLKTSLTQAHLRQIRIPEGAIVLKNDTGSAPGFHVELKGKSFFFMPGVPSEMKPMFQNEVVPRLLALFPTKLTRKQRTYRIFGWGESRISQQIGDWLKKLPENVTAHYRFAFPEVLLTLVSQKETEQEAQAQLDALSPFIYQRISSVIYGEGEKGLPELVGESLRKRGETVSTAESCTGGMLGEIFTKISGASDYYLGGIISYHNQVKKDLLGVTDSILQTQGAVSKECVEKMADGVRNQLKSTYGISISGVAGPLGGSEEKPVGTVYIGLSIHSSEFQGTKSKAFLLPGDREQIRVRACYEALDWLHRIITQGRNPS